jgi:hypothetical protein
MDPQTIWELHNVLAFGRFVNAYLAHEMKVPSAHDVLHGVITLDMLLDVNAVDMRNLFSLCRSLLELEWLFVLDVEDHFPQHSARKEFAAFKKNIELLRGMYRERRHDVEFAGNIIAYQRKSWEEIQKLFAEKARVAAPEAGRAPSEAIWEKLKTRSAPFEEILEVEGVRFRRVDLIDVLDAESEKAHSFDIKDARDKYRSRQKLRYPDGAEVQDSGMHYEGGQAAWEAHGAEPDKDLIMVTRMDYVRGDFECEMYVNDKRLGNYVCPGSDRKFRWRNWVYVVPAEFVREATVRFRQVPMTADRDVNMFTIWFYQPVTG